MDWGKQGSAHTMVEVIYLLLTSLTFQHASAPHPYPCPQNDKRCPRVIDSNYSQKTFLMHRLPILLIKKEVIESRIFIHGGYVNSALCVEGARIISVLQKNPACVIPLSL